MRIEYGAPVVLAEPNVGRPLYHLCQPARRMPVAHSGTYELTLDEAVARSFSVDWPTLCGLEGPIYAFGQAIRSRKLRTVCCKLAPPLVEAMPGAEVELADRTPRRGKPQWKHSRLKPEHLRALYELYKTRGLGVFRLGELVYEQLGYASAKSCGNSIYSGFVAMGFELRSQSEAVALKNFKHGRRRRALGETGANVAAYRRWLKEQNGRYQPVCAATKTGSSGGKGQPCTRPAMQGHEFCWSHDPSTTLARAEQLARTRALLPRRELASWREIGQRLRPFLERHPNATAARLAEATGVPHGTCSRCLKGLNETITAELAARLLRAIEVLPAGAPASEGADSEAAAPASEHPPARSHKLVLPSGKTTNVGTGVLAHAWATQLADDVAEAGIEVHVPREPEPHQRRLMETLGATVVVDERERAA